MTWSNSWASWRVLTEEAASADGRGSECSVLGGLGDIQQFWRKAVREIFQVEVGLDDLQILIQPWDVDSNPSKGWVSVKLHYSDPVEHHASATSSLVLQLRGNRQDQRLRESAACCTRSFVSKLLWVKGTSDPALQTATCLLIWDK